MKRPCHHKSLRKAEEANFKANFSFFTNLSTTNAHVFGVKFIGLHGTVGLLRFGTFLFEEKAICGLVTSGQRWMEWFPCLSRRSKNQRFALARRKTRKRIAFFKETMYDFSL